MIRFVLVYFSDVIVEVLLLVNVLWVDWCGDGYIVGGLRFNLMLMCNCEGVGRCICVCMCMSVWTDK